MSSDKKEYAIGQAICYARWLMWIYNEIDAFKAEENKIKYVDIISRAAQVSIKYRPHPMGAALKITNMTHRLASRDPVHGQMKPSEALRLIKKEIISEMEKFFDDFTKEDL